MKLSKTFVAAMIGLSAFTSTAFAEGPATANALSEQTRANLDAAMRGEAYASLKYLRYAEVAEASGHPEIAKQFREASNVEASEHFDREAYALGLGTTDAADLKDAIAGESYEASKMYIDFANQAEADGDLKVAAMFRQIAADEATHAAGYKASLESISK
ncbi:MAG: rubrerythrin [Hyphomonas sp.]|uniref:rubrerythrin family protein n=1 Tax=Hyphomonas sp. TaxID=87 RepID=UPI0017B88374|nr:rubrerythrin family protein [Hyphomonas sp.]MBA3069234.1 rubrerythrin [Hyphomonas sp.]MBU3919652.1 rubrerythrin family protein [Alphaproteobacteria bacterium]MBU4061819.1 rubrerythrin family protein [Alphaproteobacteria bacterium]MBU4163349.1 rubrerythrin family protein [Alphaproteobacteria bacterium]